MALKKLLAALIFLWPAALWAAPRSPESVFWWALFVPGGGYFAQGEIGKGLGYFGATAGMVGWGLAMDQKKSGDEINVPFVYAEQIHGTQIYLSVRESLRKLAGPQADDFKFLKDRSSASDLAMAPFRKESLLSPWVLGFAALGFGVNYVGARLDKTDRDYWDIRQARISGDTFGRGESLGVFNVYWIPLSLGAGVSEESIFRGLLQSGWEERWGKTTGWLAASTVFGAAHYNGSGPSAANALFAAVGGMYLGWRYQANGYRLREPIAAHFWFDVAAGLTIYLTDPDSNPLGAKVEFSF